jgi:hypothetical protein
MNMQHLMFRILVLGFGLKIQGLKVMVFKVGVLWFWVYGSDLIGFKVWGLKLKV